MRKLLLGIFISFGVLFLMSHNASAVSQTFYLKNGIYAYGIPQSTGSQGGNSQNITSGETYNLQNNIYAFDGSKLWYSMAFKFKSDNSNVDLSKYTDYTFTFTYCSDVNYFMPSSNDYFRMTNYYEFEADALRSITDFRDSTSSSLGFNDIERCRNVIMYGKNGIKQSTNAFQLGTTANSSFTRIFGIMPYSPQASFKPLVILSPTVVFYDNPNEAEEALQKEKEEAQQATDNSETQAENNSTNEKTTNLIGALSGIFTTISSTSATNCNITGDLGAINMGALNLCQGKEHFNSLIEFIGFSALFVVVFWASYHLIRRTLGLIDWARSN